MTAVAEAQVSGGTVVRVETDADGNAKYEAHMTKADGTPVTVYVDANYNFVYARRPDGCNLVAKRNQVQRGGLRRPSIAASRYLPSHLLTLALLAAIHFCAALSGFMCCPAIMLGDGVLVGVRPAEPLHDADGGRAARRELLAHELRAACSSDTRTRTSSGRRPASRRPGSP